MILIVRTTITIVKDDVDNKCIDTFMPSQRRDDDDDDHGDHDHDGDDQRC